MKLARPLHPAHAPAASPDGSVTDSWWPWSPSSAGESSCPESAVVFDALSRRLTATGALRSCCVPKINRVLDFVMAISPGDTCMNMAGVTLLDPEVAAAVRDWTDRMAGLHVRLSVVGASSAVARALAGFNV